MASAPQFSPRQWATQTSIRAVKGSQVGSVLGTEAGNRVLSAEDRLEPRLPWAEVFWD